MFVMRFFAVPIVAMCIACSCAENSQVDVEEGTFSVLEDLRRDVRPRVTLLVTFTRLLQEVIAAFTDTTAIDQALDDVNSQLANAQERVLELRNASRTIQELRGIYNHLQTRSAAHGEKTVDKQNALLEFANIDWCVDNACLNGASCASQLDGYQCMCDEGYEGVHCEQQLSPCEVSPCQHEGTCRSVGDSRSCQCWGGYYGEDCEQEPTAFVSSSKYGMMLYDLLDQQWSGTPIPDAKDTNSALCRLNSTHYVMAGNSGYSDKVSIYDLSGTSETPLPDYPVGRKQLNCIVIGESLYLIGGRGAGNYGQYTKYVHRLDLTAPEKEWIELPKLPSASYVSAIIPLDDQLYVVLRGRMYVYGLLDNSTTIGESVGLSLSTVLYNSTTMLVFSTNTVATYDMQDLTRGTAISYHLPEAVYDGTDMHAFMYRGEVYMFYSFYRSPGTILKLAKYDVTNNTVEVLQQWNDKNPSLFVPMLM